MNNHKNFKAIAFDFGGVIKINENGDKIDLIAQAIDVPIDEFRKVYYEHNHLSNVGNMRWEDTLMKVVRVFDKSEETEEHVRKLIKEHSAGSKINNELLALFPKLQRLELKVAILSNDTTRLRKRLEENGIAQLVDEIVVSGETGFQKPHPEIFDILFKKLNVRPEETIFVDDTPKSLEKAAEIGYAPVLFKNNEEFIADLKKLGIAV